jgi:hypothetical protein
MRYADTVEAANLHEKTPKSMGVNFAPKDV